MTDLIEMIIYKLKELIDENGPNYLEDAPYEAFQELIKSKTCDRKTASGILCFIVNGMLDDIGSNIESLSKQVQKQCGFNKSMAEKIATIMGGLYSQDNKEEWKKRNLEGLENFKQEELVCTWEGQAYWNAGNGGVVCHYKADIVLMPTEDIVFDEDLTYELKKNPFMTKEAIKDHYIQQLHEYLDCDFKYYCTCEEYYQPCVEDYLSDTDAVETWCKENGFLLKMCNGEGYDDGYEPDF